LLICVTVFALHAAAFSLCAAVFAFVLQQCSALQSTLFAVSTFGSSANAMCCIDIHYCAQCYVLHWHLAPWPTLMLWHHYQDAVALFNHAVASPLASSCSVCAGVSIHHGIFFAALAKTFVSACSHCCKVQWQFWLVAASAAVVALQ